MSENDRPERRPRADPFGRVLGHDRGLSSVAVSYEELKAAKETLSDTTTRLVAAEERASALEAQVKTLTTDLQAARARCARAERTVLDFDSQLGDLVIDRDRARYAAMHAGYTDPCPGTEHDGTHQGTWTPGRPYLSYQHAWHPKTGECYRAREGGALVGEMPGRSNRWEWCDMKSQLPLVTTPAEAREHSLAGPTLRQAQVWWEQDTPYAISGISDQHLNSIISLLRQQAEELWRHEADWSIPFVPCPWNAYPTHNKWLADTPLMRALSRERRRRQAATRRRSKTRGKEVTS